MPLSPLFILSTAGFITFAGMAIVIVASLGGGWNGTYKYTGMYKSMTKPPGVPHYAFGEAPLVAATHAGNARLKGASDASKSKLPVTQTSHTLPVVNELHQRTGAVVY